MKKSVVLFVLLLAISLMALDKSLITVKQTSVSGEVILVAIQDSGKSFELQCTKGAPNCVAPQPGSYWMVRLPKNHGLYDCANVDLYRQSANPDAGDQIVGEYCLNEK